MKKINILVGVLLLLAAAGCKDPFEMELRSSDKTLLVVDGFLNKGALTTFRLSRTIKLSDKTQVKPELRAVLTVEGKDNSRASFAERGNGTYEANLVNLETDKEYRLRIRTQDGREYLSEYVAVKNNPPIDSISWRQEDEGVRIFASTHAPANDNIRYYRWEFEETWEIRSYYISFFKKLTATTVGPRDLPAEDISVCWKSRSSSNLLLGSSAQLAEDVIKESPLTHIPRADEKLGHRYSILVKQYALSREAYEYLQLMKQNTESLGSIFDPQPSEVKGNIRSLSDPDEQVIGFITASSVQEKRLFITASELTGKGFSMWCETVQVLNHPDSIRMNLGPDQPPYDAVYSQTNPNVITHWLASSAFCVDCTSRGGINKKPSFW